MGLLTALLAAPAAAASGAPGSSAVDLDAGPIRFQARLGIFYAGFLVYSGNIIGMIADGRYSVTYEAESRGLLSLVASMETRNEVVGVLREGRFRALTYRDRIRWRQKRTAVQVAFGPEGAVRTTSTPPFAKRNRYPIPTSTSGDALDPLTTLLVGIAGTGGAKPCTWTHRVYDGRRLTRLDFENLGSDRLSGDGFTMYSGPAIKCRVRLKRLADTRRISAEKRRKEDAAEGNEATFWLAHFKRPGIWLPVRARGWSRVGAVSGGLTFFKIDGPQ